MYFEMTGNEAIDKILKEIQGAAKAYHDVNYWNETCDYIENDISPIDRIQFAANEAAESLSSK